MAILGFGRAKRLDDLKIRDLRKERTALEVQQDLHLTAIRRAEEDYSRRREFASEPGVSDAERNVAAYHMSIASKSKVKAEADLQRVITRMTVLDSTMEIIRMKEALQKKGVWNHLNQMDEHELENQLSTIAIDMKTSDNKLNTIVRMFDNHPSDVEFARGAEYDSALQDILRHANEKDDLR